MKRHFLFGSCRFELGSALAIFIVRAALSAFFVDRVRPNVFHLASVHQNCAASVEPSSAIVEDSPLLITFATSSK